jgi:hypothetical protein
LEGVTTFLLSGPYASASETEEVDERLRQLLGEGVGLVGGNNSESTQRVTANDLRAGQIRLPRAAKRFFPTERATVDVVLRGTRLTGTDDPRLGPDRERSGVLRIGKQLSDAVDENEVLTVSRGLAGIVLLD